ncbi:hypothetical protein LTR40_008349 [Exophiala xenobiotica]|nr:hypothetical protein LTR40_008349 [Exophiala xenobiotica]
MVMRRVYKHLGGSVASTKWFPRPRPNTTCSFDTRRQYRFAKFSSQTDREGDRCIGAVYHPLEPEGFRLLSLHKESKSPQIECSLKTARFEDREQYDAISYTWNGELPTVPIICNKQTILVTTALHGALQILRDQAWPRPIWVDAVNIDQANDEEKASQISLLGQIFSQASSVVVWLGPKDTNSDLAMDSIVPLTRALSDYHHPIRSVATADCIPSSSDPMWRAISDLLMRPWFSRLWVVQEITLAASAVLLCGSKHCRWEDLESLLESLYRTELSARLAEVCSLEERLQLATKASLVNIPHSYKALRTYSELAPLRFWLGFTRAQEVNTVTKQVLAPNYSPEHRRDYWKLYLKAALLHLHDGFQVQSLLQATSMKKLPQLPSWCPNFNSPRKADALPIRGVRLDGQPRREIDRPQIEISTTSMSLTLPGCFVDQALDIVPSTMGLWKDGVYGSCAVHGEVAREQQWLSECQDIAGRALAYAPEKRQSILRRTLIADTVAHADQRSPAPSDPILKIAYDGFVKVRQAQHNGETQLSKMGLIDEEIDPMFSFLHALWRTQSHRRVYLTAAGRLGVASDDIQRGDLICLFQDLDLLLVLRPSEVDETYKLVGETYVYGITGGELFEAGEMREFREVQRITLS